MGPWKLLEQDLNESFNFLSLPLLESQFRYHFLEHMVTCYKDPCHWELKTLQQQPAQILVGTT